MARQGLARYVVCAALAALIAVAYPATASAARYGSRTLRIGSHGGDVKQLQKYLTAIGLKTTADGQYGRGTAASEKKFEQHVHRPADGKASRSDQHKLANAAKSGDPVNPQDPTGGAGASAPPSNPGDKAVIGPDGRTAIAPDDAPPEVKNAIAAANRITDKPYRYGGGHGSFEDSGYDCSGSVSYALHGGGWLDTPEDSSELESFGSAGKGSWVTVYANSGHAFAVIAGLRFDTSGDASGSGPRWHEDMASTSGYVVRHPTGF